VCEELLPLLALNHDVGQLGIAAGQEGQTRPRRPCLLLNRLVRSIPAVEGKAPSVARSVVDPETIFLFSAELDPTGT
jgi:hypothetical protein